MTLNQHVEESDRAPLVTAEEPAISPASDVSAPGDGVWAKHATPPALCVLKFGSSVLASEDSYPQVVQEIYRHYREGEKVVAIISALAGETDSLFAQAARVGDGDSPDKLVARLVRVGELKSAALMALALSKAGLRATTLDPDEIGLGAEGAALDSSLTKLDTNSIWAALGSNDVIVVPGFIAGHEEHGLVTLGRGGTDLSAVFFADRLGAKRVRLIKDVDGVYESDPALNADARRFSELDYDTAEKASSGLIQVKAIHAAKERNLAIEVASLGSPHASLIAPVAVKTSSVVRPSRTRVALLGCGSVGAGVLALLQAQPDLFEIAPVLVRRPGHHRERAEFTARVEVALARKPDILVELIGGTDVAVKAMHSALASGAEVVTANKAAIAAHWDSLHASSVRHGGALRFSAAVGGGTPIIETVRRLDGSIVALEGIVNGTCNFLLDRLGEGWSFDRALKAAQDLGFAEADPSSDVDGDDAAAKLSILIRESLGLAVAPSHIAKQSLRDLDPKEVRNASLRGERYRQVSRFALVPGGGVEAEVAIEALPEAHPLACVKEAQNRFLVHDKNGTCHDVWGLGAGRWPTATSVFADIMDAQRALQSQVEEGDCEPLRRIA